MVEDYLIDTHSHLYSEEFLPDLAEVVDRARIEGIKRIYLPAIDSKTANSMFQLEKDYPDLCIAMIGLHPCYVKANFREELQFVKKCLETRKFAAVGEIGLDYHWDRSFDAAQKESFSYQVDLALHYDLPIVIHSRDSMEDTIALVGSKQNGSLKGIFHCFSGTYEQAVQIIDLGFLLGIGGVLTYKKSGLAEIVGRLPMESMVLETDAPYLTPVPFRGKRNESAYLKHIAVKLGEIKNLSLGEVSRITSANAERLFKYSRGE